jgi:hypothetical protein
MLLAKRDELSDHARGRAVGAAACGVAAIPEPGLALATVALYPEIACRAADPGAATQLCHGKRAAQEGLNE